MEFTNVQRQSFSLLTGAAQQQVGEGQRRSVHETKEEQELLTLEHFLYPFP